VSIGDFAAGVMLGGLVIYALLAGADFGGGVWDLLATGPRRHDQRKLIEKSIAPVWEANHVWLIFVVVTLFTCFPGAFSAASIALHIPLTAMLLGIVLRGAAFAFRQYSEKESQLRWGRVFAVASVVTPVFLGVVVGAISSGGLRIKGGLPEGGYFSSWLGAFPFAAGAFALALFSFLAAVYLTVEAAEDPALQEDFRLRAFAAGLAVGVCALVAALVAGPTAAPFRASLFGSSWSLPHQIVTGLAAAGALAALWLRRYRLARFLAAAQVTLILVGWGLAQHPFLIRPDITIAGAAAPAHTIRLNLLALGFGAVVLIPSLYYLFRVFKSPPAKAR
jgi:cytochrome bd ubiquinol oxidase subunit II